MQLYKIADGTDIWTYLAGLQLTATFYVGQQYSDEDATITYYLTSHVCNLTGGVVEYTVDLAESVVSLTDRSKDDFLQAVCVFPCTVSISETNDAV